MNYRNNYGNDLNYHGEGEDEYIRKHRPPAVYTNPKAGVPALLLWLALTGGATAFLCLKYELWTICFFFIQAVIGIVLFLTSDRLRRTKNILIYILVVAVFCAGLVYLRLTFPTYFEKMNGRFMTNMFVSLISAVGGGLMVHGPVHYRAMLRRCTVPVNATVVRLNYTTRKAAKLYSPVFRFGFGSQKYEACEYCFYRGGVPQVGDTVRIFVDPDDPVTIHDPVRGRNKMRIDLVGGIGLFILGFATMLLFALSGFGLFEH